MKLHAAALVLTIWYLMNPPLPHLNTHSLQTDTARPLSRWTIVGRFPTQTECETHLKRWQRCVTSDDPRLKKNSPQSARIGFDLSGYLLFLALPT